MIGRISVVAISICIAACASSGPEAPAVTASSASVDAVASDNPPAPPAGDFQDLDAPDVLQTASASPASDPDEIICRRERETGSKFTTRICRTRGEIAAREAQDQEILRGIRTIQTGSECALTGEC